MLINLKNNLHWLIYSTGLFVYFLMLAQTTLTLSIIWLLFVLYIWLIISIINQQYYFKSLLYVFCSSGIIVAVSLFFIYGVEQVPLPVGAILFREEGILPALLLLFVFSVPILVYNHDSMSELAVGSTTPPNIVENNKTPQRNKKHLEASEEWEEATIEDLESGSYELI